MMNKILVLGSSPACEAVGDILLRHRENPTVAIIDDDEGIRDDALINFRLIVSYGYKRLITPKVINSGVRIINIHNSFLPWNGGADPNFWSWYNQTPKGVTIHQVTEKIDAGCILAQILVVMGSYNETLATSYKHLHGSAMELFDRKWPLIRDGILEPKPQTGISTYHRKADREAIWHLFPDGWDTPCDVVEKIGETQREKAARA